MGNKLSYKKMITRILVGTATRRAGEHCARLCDESLLLDAVFKFYVLLSFLFWLCVIVILAPYPDDVLHSDE